MISTLINILVFIATVLILVSIHEFGHFWVARKLGVKVLRFSIGFGKPIWRYLARNGTEYVVAVLPLGGYVKLLDEREADVPEADKHLAFNRQPLLVRTAIVTAGPVINLLFGVVAFWMIWMIGMDRVRPVVAEVLPHSIAAMSGLPPNSQIVGLDDHPTDSWQKIIIFLIRRLGDSGELHIEARLPQEPYTHRYVLPLSHWSIEGLEPNPLKSLGIIPYTPSVPPIVHTLESEGPALKGGIQVGDRILSVDNQRVKDWKDFASYIQKHPLQLVHIVIQRGQQQLSFNVETAERLSRFRWIGYLGIQSAAPIWPPGMRYTLQLSPVNALIRGLEDTWTFVYFNFLVLKKMVVGDISLSSLGGPISIFQTSSLAFQQGLVIYLAFLGLISIMLACLNILPIPGLDGGHLLFFLVEAIIRRPIPLRWQLLILRLGFILLMLIIVRATVNDLMRTLQ